MKILSWNINNFAGKENTKENIIKKHEVHYKKNHGKYWRFNLLEELWFLEDEMDKRTKIAEEIAQRIKKISKEVDGTEQWPDIIVLQEFEWDSAKLNRNKPAEAFMEAIGASNPQNGKVDENSRYVTYFPINLTPDKGYFIKSFPVVFVKRNIIIIKNDSLIYNDKDIWGRWLGLNISYEGMDIVIFGMHIPLNPERRKTFKKELLKNAEEIKENNQLAILIGDFNAHNDFHAPKENISFLKDITENGFIDSWKLNNNRDVSSFKTGKRIDYALLSDEFNNKFNSFVAYEPEENAFEYSDHKMFVLGIN